ncbi:MAG: ABC transporter ATP-binding protein [Bacteroidota bacterium]
MNILEYRDVVKTFDSGVRALNRLTLTVPKGVMYGFIGLNGAGKTTSIRILAGLSKKDSGSIRLFGKELEEHDYTYKRDIGFVLDQPLYFDWMTAPQYLNFVGAMYNLGEEEIRTRSGELLEFFDLKGREDDPIKYFSTGMKKKISLAGAIIHNPQLIVLDEPLEGIDALAASSIKETLMFMVNRGATIFITSHVLDTVEKLCQEIAIIHKGEILLQCPTGEIRTRMKNTTTNQTYQSLEELFVDYVSEEVRKKHLSFL